MSKNENSIKKMVGAIKASIKGREITANNLLIIVVSAIETAETFALNGEGKKAVVIEALEAIIDETVKDIEIAGFIKMLLPSTIDTAVALTKGKFDINISTGCCWGKKK